MIDSGVPMKKWTVLTRVLVTSCLALIVASCGGDSATTPSGSGNSGGGSGGGANTNRGLFVTIDGATYTPAAAVAVRSAANGTTPELVLISSSNATTVFAFGGVAQVGTQTISPGNPVNANMTILSSGGTTGVGYLAINNFGSGSVTITSLSATAVSGQVDLVLAPTTGGASRVVRGTYNLAF